MIININDYSSDFLNILNKMTDVSSVLEQTKQYLDKEFGKYNLGEKERLTIMAKLLSDLTIAFTTNASSVALELQRLKLQEKTSAELSDAEIEFNKARTKLVTAQELTEKEKKNAVIREVKSYDDNLRVKEAECLKDAVFGYAAGGVLVPESLQSTMLSAIDKVTP
ncbi:hypothetical protein A9K75_08740 [Campylobacter fetus subsp. testudinum]|uniref:hypothetical protein n=1 Tax=Campylobacter fetus TaxID=196 RepID=UPI0008187BD7|nr:hypothetical protein [Campylobacter fetus]OCR99049.1 hypothetical protein A9K75_08740 [Campylobacter fetus subsp. testudinum]OCS09272.1 hypothetical protein CFTD6783_08950 [Campylobacter fetus subsp. testudinum]